MLFPSQFLLDNTFFCIVCNHSYRRDIYRVVSFLIFHFIYNLLYKTNKILANLFGGGIVEKFRSPAVTDIPERRSFKNGMIQNNEGKSFCVKAKQYNIKSRCYNNSRGD